MPIDPRIVRVGIQVGDVLKTYEGLQITATGTKYANANQDECEVKIDNLDKATRDAILTDTSPFNTNRKRKKLIVEAGRVSYGTTKIFTGDIITSTIGQPPDISVTLKALTGNFQKGIVTASTHTQRQRLQNISQGVAQSMGLNLSFQAKDRDIGNYNYSGSLLKQVNKLADIGGVNAYIDNDTLVVKDFNVPLNGRVRDLDLDSGLIGIPEVTEQGVKVTFLLDNQTVVGSGIVLTSRIYPALNGTYCIYKLGFNIASRDTPFYWVAEAKRLNR